MRGTTHDVLELDEMLEAINAVFFLPLGELGVKPMMKESGELLPLCFNSISDRW